MDVSTSYALLDELTKISSDIKMHQEPAGTLQRGLAGKYFNPGQVADEPVLQGVSGGKKHVMAMAPKEDFRTAMRGTKDFVGNPEGADALGDAAYKSTKRHELTHYLRQKKGLMDRYGKPGIRGVLTTGREEVAGHLSGLAPYKKMGDKAMSQASSGVIPGVIGSVKATYPQGVGKAMTEGTIGKVLGFGKKLMKTAT